MAQITQNIRVAQEKNNNPIYDMLFSVMLVLHVVWIVVFCITRQVNCKYDKNLSAAIDAQENSQVFGGLDKYEEFWFL
jgi:hypothetical protein